MASPVNPESLASARTSKTYSSFGSATDLVAEKGGPCRRIRINAAGSGALQLTYADKTVDTIPGLLQGDVLDVQASKIGATGDGTSVAGITVFW